MTTLSLPDAEGLARATIGLENPEAWASIIATLKSEHGMPHSEAWKHARAVIWPVRRQLLSAAKQAKRAEAKRLNAERQQGKAVTPDGAS